MLQIFVLDNKISSQIFKSSRQGLTARWERIWRTNGLYSFFSSFLWLKLRSLKPLLLPIGKISIFPFTQCLLVLSFPLTLKYSLFWPYFSLASLCHSTKMLPRSLSWKRSQLHLPSIQTPFLISVLQYTACSLRTAPIWHWSSLPCWNDS